MKTVLITLAKEPAANYPFAVVVIHEDGRRGQETTCRTLRDARIYANGVCAGAALAAGNHDTWPVNPIVDDRFDLD